MLPWGIKTWAQEVMILTFGSSPNWPNCTSFNRLRAVLMISLHFLVFLLLSQPERDNKLLLPKRKTKALDLTIKAHPETERFGAFSTTGAPPFLPCSSHSQTLGHSKSLKQSPHTNIPPCDLQFGFTNYLKYSFLNKMPCKSCRRKKS